MFVFLFVGLAFFEYSATAQEGPPPQLANNFQLSAIRPSTTMLARGTTSDQAAIAAMRTVLTHLGGAQAWRNIRSSESHATVSTLDGTKSNTLYLLDDWSKDTTRFRRRSPALKGPPRDHNGTAATVVHAKAGDKVVPEFDQARVLLGHLPGAAVEIILRKPDYVLKTSTAGHCGATQQCVDVYRKPKIGPTFKEQEWVISTATGLPIVVRYAIQNVNNPTKSIWEEVEYKSFQTVQGVLVSSQVEMGFPGGRRQTFSYSAPVLNQPFNTTAFDSEAIR